MDYVRLGTSGLKVSRICLGMMSYGDRSSRAWHLDEEAGEPIVRRAVEAGVTYFDTADMYDDGLSEEVTGRLLGRLFARRDDYVLATKVYYPMGPGPNDGGLSRKHVLAAIDASLGRLGTDHVDLYQVHRWDSETPIEETMGALHDVVRAGEARYIGASAMFAWQLAKAQFAAERSGLTPARGVLAASRNQRAARADSDPVRASHYGDGDLDVVEAVRAVAAERGLPPAQIALAWLLGRPAVSATVVGATKLGHVDDAVAALGVVLSDEEVARLEAPYRPHPVIGHS